MAEFEDLPTASNEDGPTGNPGSAPTSRPASKTGIITPAQAARIAAHCPCGGQITLVEHLTGTGLCRDGVPTQNIKRFWRALYYDQRHDRDFCSAICALKWVELFALTFEKHISPRR